MMCTVLEYAGGYVLVFGFQFHEGLGRGLAVFAGFWIVLSLFVGVEKSGSPSFGTQEGILAFGRWGNGLLVELS